MKYSYKTRSGFSLFELLAAVAILAILTVLVFSGMRQISARSKSVRCLTNLKALHAAAFAYAGDHQGEIPVDRENRSSGITWYMALKDRYIKHAGYGRRAEPFFCLANRRDTSSGGNDGWTNYAMNGNLYEGGLNLSGVPAGSSSEVAAEHLQSRRGPRFQMFSADKALFLDSRSAAGSSWYSVSGTRWNDRRWADSYAVHEDSLNVIFIGGHARTVRVAPRVVSSDGSLNELKAEWFWPVQ